MKAINSKNTGRRGQAGFSLVELMVALALGMLVVVALGYVFLGSKQSMRSMDATSRIQENARNVFETMSYDIRMAGFAGCAHSTRANVLNNANTWGSSFFDFPLQGYEEGQSTFPSEFAANVLRGDALTVLRADNQREYLVDSHVPEAAQFNLTSNHDIKLGEIVVATDCSHAAVLQMSNANINNSISTLVHNTGAGSPGNCTKGLGAPVDCSNPLGTSYTFAPGSRILRLSSVAYHLRLNAEGEPALYRLRQIASAGVANWVAEELAEGVENMQLTYGVDTSATADGAVDAYVTADQVANVAPGASLDEKWRRVLSVRVSLLMVSQSNESITTMPQRYTFNGVTTTPNDRRLRKVMDYTIAVRNRL